VPTFNRYLTGRNTFFWDKRVHALHAGDYTKAEIFHWLHDDADRFMAVPVLASRKKPLESRIWYAYAGQEVGVEGSSNRPVGVARLLDPIPGVSPRPEQTARYEYNSKGHPTLIRDPRGRETVLEYASNQIDLTAVKQRNTSNGSLETLVSVTYNGQHRPLTVTSAAGQVTTFTYNAYGQTTSVVTPPRQNLTPGQRTTTYTYDPKGYLVQITRPLTSGGLAFSRDPYGRIRTMTSADGYTLTADYDALDRLTRLTYPDGTYESRTYNRLDLEQFRDRLGRLVSATWDSEQRLTSLRDGSGRTTAFEWCGCGMMERLVDPNGNATSWERDLQGRVTREVRADGKAWSYVYEETTSRLKERIDAMGQRTHYEYHADDFLKRQSYTVVPPQIAAPAVDLVWDTMYPRMTRVATEGLNPIDITYVPISASPSLGAGRLQSVSGAFDESTVSYSYDEMGRPVTQGLPGVSVTWTYDLMGRVTGVSDPVAGAFGLTYDGPTARPTAVTYPNGQRSNYEYFDNAGDRQLKTITHLAPNASVLSRFEYTYDRVGNLRTWQQQLGASPAKVYDFGYDAADKLIAATLRSTGGTPSVLRRHGYGFDRAGNRTASQLDAGVTAATFDNRNRLLSTQPGGAILFRGEVNEPATVVIAGQPASTPSDLTFSGQAPLGSGTTLVDVTATDASNRSRTNRYSVTQSGASAAYSHDANGNLTFDGSKTYHWDSENRLVKVTQGATELARFVYDGWGRRVQKIAGGVTWTYVLDGAHVVQERSSAGPTRRYVPGPGIDRPLARVVGSTVEAFYLADHLGSIVQETNTLGAPILTREYDPYGNQLQGATSSGFAFTGREWDAEVGLYFYRARYYSPVLGRFISEDPIRWRLGHVNPYPYVDGNPGRYVDPTGEVWVWVAAAVVVAVVAYVAFSDHGAQVASSTASESFDQAWPNKAMPPVDLVTNMDEIIPPIEDAMARDVILRVEMCLGQPDPTCQKLLDQARAWCEVRKPKPGGTQSAAAAACKACEEP
jgi:RHS repeat-associated protein